MQNPHGRSPAEHVPLVQHTPSLRCFQTREKDRYAICGELAQWRRPGNHWFDDEYFCEAHRSPIDVPIAGELVVRRVKVTADIFLSGASMADPFARAEALKRLSDAVAVLGAVVDVTWIRSSVVRYAAPPVPGATLARSGLGE